MPKAGTDGVPIVGDVNIVGCIVGGGPIDESSPSVGFVIVVPLISPSSCPFAFLVWHVGARVRQSPFLGIKVAGREGATRHVGTRVSQSQPGWTEVAHREGARPAERDKARKKR